MSRRVLRHVNRQIDQLFESTGQSREIRLQELSARDHAETCPVLWHLTTETKHGWTGCRAEFTHPLVDPVLYSALNRLFRPCSATAEPDLFAEFWLIPLPMGNSPGLYEHDLHAKLIFIAESEVLLADLLSRVFLAKSPELLRLSNQILRDVHEIRALVPPKMDKSVDQAHLEILAKLRELEVDGQDITKGIYENCTITEQILLHIVHFCECNPGVSDFGSAIDAFTRVNGSHYVHNDAIHASECVPFLLAFLSDVIAHELTHDIAGHGTAESSRILFGDGLGFRPKPREIEFFQEYDADLGSMFFWPGLCVIHHFDTANVMGIFGFWCVASYRLFCDDLLSTRFLGQPRGEFECWLCGATFLRDTHHDEAPLRALFGTHPTALERIGARLAPTMYGINSINDTELKRALVVYGGLCGYASASFIEAAWNTPAHRTYLTSDRLRLKELLGTNESVHRLQVFQSLPADQRASIEKAFAASFVGPFTGWWNQSMTNGDDFMSELGAVIDQKRKP